MSPIVSISKLNSRLIIKHNKTPLGVILINPLYLDLIMQLFCGILCSGIMLNRFDKKLRRYNLAAQLAQIGMISIPIVRARS